MLEPRHKSSVSFAIESVDGTGGGWGNGRLYVEVDEQVFNGSILIIDGNAVEKNEVEGVDVDGRLT